MKTMFIILSLLLVCTAASLAAECGCNQRCGVDNTCENRPSNQYPCTGMWCATDPGDPTKCIGEFACFEFDEVTRGVKLCGAPGGVTPVNLPELLFVRGT